MVPTIAWGPCPPVADIVGSGVAGLCLFGDGTINTTQRWPRGYLTSDELSSRWYGRFNIEGSGRVDDVPIGR